MTKCLTDSDYARRIAQNGQQIIRKNQGATRKTVDQIAKILGTSKENHQRTTNL
jgi:hypothetical protein